MTGICDCTALLGEDDVEYMERSIMRLLMHLIENLAQILAAFDGHRLPRIAGVIARCSTCEELHLNLPLLGVEGAPSADLR